MRIGGICTVRMRRLRPTTSGRSRPRRSKWRWLGQWTAAGVCVVIGMSGGVVVVSVLDAKILRAPSPLCASNQPLPTSYTHPINPNDSLPGVAVVLARADADGELRVDFHGLKVREAVQVGFGFIILCVHE